MKTPLEEKHLSASDNALLKVARIDGTNLTPKIFANKYRKDGVSSNNYWFTRFHE